MARGERLLSSEIYGAQSRSTSRHQRLYPLCPWQQQPLGPLPRTSCQHPKVECATSIKRANLPAATSSANDAVMQGGMLELDSTLSWQQQPLGPLPRTSCQHHKEICTSPEGTLAMPGRSPTCFFSRM